MKKPILMCLLLSIGLLGCFNQMDSPSDFKKSTFLLASTDQFGDSSELIGIDSEGKINYEKKLNFGGIINIINENEMIQVFTYDHIYNLSKKDHRFEKVKSDLTGSVYRDTIKTYHNKQYYVCNEGFDDPYYKNTIFEDGEEMLKIEGVTMNYDFRGNNIYVLYTHTASMSQGPSDYKIDYYDIDTREKKGSVDLAILDRFVLLSGVIVDNYFYIYGYAAHDLSDESVAFVKVNLDNGEISEIPIDEKNKNSLQNNNHQIVLNQYRIEENLYSIQENGNFIRWNTVTDAIESNTLDNYDSKYMSLYKISSENELIRIGYEGEKMYLFRYDLKHNKLLNKIMIDYEVDNRMVLYDFVIMNK